MTEGTQHSDGQFLVGDNGQAAIEKVTTHMSKDTKAQIEAEFEALGVSNWQELMANLINKRHQLNSGFRQMSVAETAPTPNTKTNWWMIGLVGLLTIAGLIFLFKKSSLPKISFANG